MTVPTNRNTFDSLLFTTAPEGVKTIFHKVPKLIIDAKEQTNKHGYLRPLQYIK